MESGSCGDRFVVGGAVGYFASDGDWGWALAGAIGGGLIGGASFDQGFRGWDGGTRGATKALVLKPTSFGIATGELLASVGREYLALQANPRAQLAYNAFTQALVNLGQAAGEKEYVIENVKNGNYKFRSQYKFNRLTGDVSDCCWKIDPSIDITAAIGSRDLFVHNLRDPETNAAFNINYYGSQGGSGVVNGHAMYDNLAEGFIAGNALFRGGPSIALTRGENDIIIFSFFSIHSRNSFFRHYFNKGKNHQLKDMARRFPQ